jgi:hypothetical protein
MSWLKKLLSTPEPQRYKSTEEIKREQLSAARNKKRSEISERIPAIFAAMQASIEQELAQLTAFGLPLPTPLLPPREQTPWTVDYEYEWNATVTAIHVQTPHFAIPIFHYFVARTKGQPQGMFYLVADKGDSHKGQLFAAHASSKLGAFLEQFPGRWFNRDPYAVFHHFNQSPYQGFNDSVISNPPEQIAASTPLQEVAGFSRAEILRMEQIITLYQGLSANMITESTEVLLSSGRPKTTYESRTMYLSDKVLFDLPIPLPAFPPSPITLTVLPPPTTKPSVMRDLLYNLPPLEQPIAFELVDDGSTITYQIVCAPEDKAQVIRQLHIALPHGAIIERVASPHTPPLHSLTCTLPEYTLRIPVDTATDPLTQVFDILTTTQRGETVALQFLCSPFPTAIANRLIEEMGRGYHIIFGNNYENPNNSFYLYRDESFCNKLKNKLPFWRTTIRLLASNPKTLLAVKAKFLDKFALPDKQWMYVERTESLSRRDMTDCVLLSSAELASLAHFPATEIRNERLETASMRAKLPPDLFTTGEVQIGVSEARGEVRPVAIPDSVRARHLYIVGKSGSGKSTLITNIAVQDIKRGEGVCVIDPHGDLVSDLLDRIPEHRVSDTIYFNVSDREHPIGLDMMNAKSEAEIEILTDDLITTFRRLTESWGERMETILRYAFNTLLRTPKATFLDVQKLLTNEGWRSSVVRNLNFPPLTDFWYSQFPNMPKDATQPILSRMTKIVLSPTLNAIFGQSENTLNFNDVIHNRKILLINLGGDSRDRNNEQLAVSDEMKKLIGSVIVSQLQLAAMRQASMPEAQRVPCRFFVDEFQNFVSGAFPKILSEARKYKLSLTVAHQYISQLDEATRNAVFGNVGTMIVMPLGQKDAAYLGAELGAYTPEDVANLSPERHDALCRPTTMAADTFLFTTLAPAQITRSFAQVIIDHTRAGYSAAAAEDDVLDLPPLVAEDSLLTKRPMRETPKVFASTAEKILHFVSLAGYLTTSQIIELCYSHLSEASKRPAASRDLKKLTDAKKLKSINWNDGKVFYVGGQCNPTAHNVAVRDILIRILQSGYEVAEVNFSASLGVLSPDLLVTFLCEDGSLLPTYWEYDTGTEGITEILKKIARYVPYSTSSRIAFICSTRERVRVLLKATQADFIECAILDELTGLNAPAFISRTCTDRYSFF